MSDRDTERPSDNAAEEQASEPAKESSSESKKAAPAESVEQVEAHVERQAEEPSSTQYSADEQGGNGGAFARVTRDRGDLWQRALFMVLFAVLFGVAKFVLWMVVVVQFLVVLFSGSANEQLLRLGSSLSIYVYQVFRFLTFTGDEQPFPMSAWPADEAEESPWFDTRA